MTTTRTAPSIRDRYAERFAASRDLYHQAREVFPDGVTHDLRYLEPFPPYIDRARGSRKWDIAGNEWIDYWSGHGAMLLGHSHPVVVDAVREQMSKVTHAGGCHALEIAWGDWVRKLVPTAERVRFTASGTEATLMAFRLARMFTGKPKILKFVGHFHGWHDAVMPGAYAPYDSAPIPGIPEEVARQTVVLPPNQLNVLERTLREDSQIAAVILEPTGGHWGAVPIRGEFLRALREWTTKYGVLLIFDEVITGFRIAPGGAQAIYEIRPDLTTLAKVLAGGLPGGALAGRADLLAGIEQRPGKPKMRHPGTFNANPLSAAAGVATLEIVATGEPSNHANQMGRLLRQRLNERFAERDWPWVAYGEFSMFRLIPGYSGSRPVVDPLTGTDAFIPYDGDVHRLEAAKPATMVSAFRQALLLNGIDIPGLGGWLSAAHTPADVLQTVEGITRAIEWLDAEGLGPT